MKLEEIVKHIGQQEDPIDFLGSVIFDLMGEVGEEQKDILDDLFNQLLSSSLD